MVLGGGFISTYGIGSLNIWKGTINAERYIQILDQHMLPSRCLLQGRAHMLQQDDAKPHTAAIQKQHGFMVEQSRRFTYCKYLEHYEIYDKEVPGLLSRQERCHIPLSKSRHILASWTFTNCC